MTQYFEPCFGRFRVDCLHSWEARTASLQVILIFNQFVNKDLSLANLNIENLSLNPSLLIYKTR